MVDYNVEFAHIYADKEFGDEQRKSIDLLKLVIKDLQKKNKSFVTCILIDEISPEKITLNESDFLKKTLSYKIPLDFVAYESKLSSIADKIIKELPKELLHKESFNDKEVLLLIKDNLKIGLKDYPGKHSCSLLIAAWILCRLGYYKAPNLKNLTGNSFNANKLITILPKRYRKTEDKVLNILKITKYNHILKNLEYKFF